MVAIKQHAKILQTSVIYLLQVAKNLFAEGKYECLTTNYCLFYGIVKIM